MSSLITKGNASGTGSVTLESPNTNSDFTISLPASAGTAMVSGNMPAFYAYNTGNQSISQNTSTKLQFNTEGFDTNNCYDNVTNYRFTPNVAGYYQLSGGVFVSSIATQVIIQIFKNGSIFMEICRVGDGSPNVAGYGSGLVYANGSTDYFELYVNTFSAAVTLGAGQPYFYFTGAMVRAA